MTVPIGDISAVSQSYWSPRLYQQIPRTGRPLADRVSSDAVSAASHSLPWSTARPRLEVSDTQNGTW